MSRMIRQSTKLRVAKRIVMKSYDEMIRDAERQEWRERQRRSRANRRARAELGEAWAKWDRPLFQQTVCGERG